MAIICTNAASDTEEIIFSTGVYSCPINYGRLGAKNKAPFYAFRGAGGIMRCAWKLEFNGQALVITPGTDLDAVRRQVERQVNSAFFNPSSEHVDRLCEYVRLSYPLGQKGKEDYTQKQYYHFLEMANKQPDFNNLPYAATNPQRMANYDWNDFLRGGALYVK